MAEDQAAVYYKQNLELQERFNIWNPWIEKSLEGLRELRPDKYPEHREERILRVGGASNSVASPIGSSHP